MHKTIQLSRRPVLLRLLALGTVVTLLLVPGMLGPESFGVPSTARPVAAVRVAADAVVGGVPWPLGRFGCVACAGAFLAAGGGTTFGVLLAASIWPQAAAFCAVGCYRAFRR